MSNDLDQRLRRDLSALDDAPIAAGWRARDAAASAVRRMHRRRRAAAAAVAGLIVMVGAVGIWTRRSANDDRADEQDQPSPTTAVEDPSSIGSWRALAADPRGAVVDAAVVWADGAAIAVGGRTSEGDMVAGAVAYDPDHDTWEPLATPSAPSGAVGRVGALAVWTGHEVLVIGGGPTDGGPFASSGSGYDPATGAWRPLAAAPGPVSDDAPWVWTGTELLVWPAVDAETGVDGVPVAYDPVTDRWRRLPSPPLPHRQEAASVWTGTEWLIWGGADGTTAFADGAAYDPATDSWRVLAASPLSPRRVRGVWTGSELIVAAGSIGGEPVTGNGAFAYGDGAAYDPLTDRWRPIADGPAHPAFEPVWTGTELLLFAKGGVVAYDPRTDRWRDDCCGTSGSTASSTPVWTGDEAVLIGSADPRTGGVAFRPVR